MKHFILYASIVVASGLLLTNIYNSMIDVTSWGADIPHSIEAARTYFKAKNPGDFFRIFSPINQILALLALVFFWKSSKIVRLCLAVALVLYVLGDVFTFVYFYPRNDIMFKTANLTDIDTLRAAWDGWSTMNWLRSLIVLIGLIFSFMGLHKINSVK